MQNATSLVDLPAVLEALEQLRVERRTGTLFITTDSGHAVRFVLSKGDVTGCHYRDKIGDEALPLVRDIQAARYSFVVSVAVPEDSRARPDPNALRALMAGNGSVPTPEPGGGPDLSRSRLGEAVRQIQHELAKFIGPAAVMVCNDYLEQAGEIIESADIMRMIDAVAGEAGDHASAQQFREQVLAELQEDGAT